jgi:hypothetical protein
MIDSNDMKMVPMPKPKRGFIGWELPASERNKLLELIPTLYPDVLAHHVTLKHGVKEGTPLPTETFGEVVGITHDDRVQALVVKIDGMLLRPDFGVFHITWSIDRAQGAKPFHSNACISANGFKWLETPITISLVPKFFAD